LDSRLFPLPGTPTPDRTQYLPDCKEPRSPHVTDHRQSPLELIKVTNMKSH